MITMDNGKERRKTRNQIAGVYDLCETIGEGHYAVVKLAKHVFTGETVAIKVIDKMKMDSATWMQMLQEVRLMKLVQHPFVVRLYDVIDTQTKLYLVLEFADGGDMYDYIMKHEGGLKEETARKYFRQIVTAIQYCHKLHVVHRDLKPENVVFFEKQGLVKLTDFGFSNKFSPGQTLRTSCGSLAYSAPEILLGDAYDAPAVDIWSLGIILYMLVCGAAPFQEANDSETLTMIMDCKYTFPTHISQDCKNLISRMLQRQPDLRASLFDIIRDPWLNDVPFQTAEKIKSPSWLEDMIPEEAFYPLTAREHLTEEEHSHILQKMVLGSIANKDEIIDSLDQNEYNHITATYFLLAERKLNSHKMKSFLSPLSTSGLKFGANQSFTPKEFTTCQKALVKDIPESPSDIQSQMKCLINSSKGSTKLNPRTQALSGARLQCAIVEEESEEEEDKKWSCLDSSQTELSLERSLDKVLPPGSGVKLETPAPFPLTSQIGTGGLSRQSSLRKSGVEKPFGSSPPSGSPSFLQGSNHLSSSLGSAGRLKVTLPNRKLTPCRSSPQLVTPILPLNQIHEEGEESSVASVLVKDQVDLVDHFPSTVAGVVVTKRLELRRRMRLLKARTASCSSSEASDDDSELQKNGLEEHEMSDYTPSPPPRSMHRGRNRQNDDSSDSQDQCPGGNGASNNQSVLLSDQQISNKTSSNCHESNNGSTEQKGNVKHQSTHRHRHHVRIRHSKNQNKMIEPQQNFENHHNKNLHIKLQPSSGMDSDRSEILSRRNLDHLKVCHRKGDESSESEMDGFQVQEHPRPPRRSKTNLLSTNGSLNKIQEYCGNDDVGNDGDISDNVSTTVFKNKDSKSDCFILELKSNKTFDSTKSVLNFEIADKKKWNDVLHRAHSCGSLITLKKRESFYSPFEVVVKFRNVLKKSNEAKSSSKITSTVG